MTELNPQGQIVYSTFLGGSSDDHGTGIAVNTNGDAYICGFSYSSDYPTTTGAVQRDNHGGYDSVVTELNPTGTALLYSTYLGGSDDDYATAITLDGQENAYVVGITYSTDYPTKSPIQGGVEDSMADAFVTKINPTGTALVYSTYVRGSGDDAAYGVAVDSNNEAIVVGVTNSADFPVTSGAFQKTNNGAASNGGDFFVTKFNAAGTGYVYSTFLGGSIGVPQLPTPVADAGGPAIALDSSGDAYITGSTYDPDFPVTLNAAQQTKDYVDADGLSNAIVAEFGSSGGLIYSTYLGGGGINTSSGGQAIAVDGQGDAFVAGYTSQPDFPIIDPLSGQSTLPQATDGFVTEVSPDGSTFLKSTFLGGTYGTIPRDRARRQQRLRRGPDGGLRLRRQLRYANFPTTTGALEPTDPKVNGMFDDQEGDPTGFVSVINMVAPGAGEFALGPTTFQDPTANDISVFETTEAAPYVTITVTRTGGDGTAASVNYTTVPGTAKAGVNFTTTSGTLSFAVGQSTATFRIPIDDDSGNNGTSDYFALTVTLSSPTNGATIEAPYGTADVHIYNIETSNIDTAANNGNDLFDDAIPIVGENVTVTGDNTLADADEGDDGGDPWDIYDFGVTDSKNVSNPKDDGGASVWWVWSPTAGSVVTINTFGSNFDTMLSVFGPDNQLVENDDANLSTSQSSVTFLAQVGDTYRIDVQGYDYGGGAETGSITLNIVSATAGTVQLSAASYSVSATAGSITIPITRTGGTTGAASVELTTTQGTAKAGTDYTTTTKTVNWASGSSTTQDVTIPILNSNGLDGSAPQFTVGLEDVSGASIGTPSTSTVTINENTATGNGTIALGASTYSVYEGNGYITIPVMRLGGSSGAVSVTVATSGGTAVSGTDYAPVSTTLNWASGDSTTKYITVPLFYDAAAGTTNRTVNVTLSVATGGATLGSPSSAVVTIDETSGVSAGSPPSVELIDESPDGTQAGDVAAEFPSISDDGRYEVFQSNSDNLVTGSPVPLPSDNVFLRDRQTDTTSIVSVDPTGKNVGNHNSTFPIISGNGQYVVFLSAATNLVADDNPENNNPTEPDLPYVEVLVRNLETGITVLASKDESGNPIQADCESISISDNGSEVAFDDMENVYLYNVQTDTTTVLTASGNGPSNNPVLSADGNYVAFDSLANNLDPNDTDIELYDNYQVYEGNVQTGAVKLVSTDVAGTGAGTDGTSVFASVSANGRYVAFQSDSKKLVSTPVQGGSVQDVYVRDMTKSSPTLVSLDTAGTAGGDSSSFQPEISANAAYIAFFSLANNLTTNDSGNEMIASEEVFERNLNTNTTILVSTNAAGTGIPNNTSKLGNEFQSYENPAQQAAGAISGDGQYVLFESLASNVVPNEVDQNQGEIYPTDIYVRNTVTNTTTLISHKLGTNGHHRRQHLGRVDHDPERPVRRVPERGRRPREQRHERAADQRLRQPNPCRCSVRHDSGGILNHLDRRRAQRDRQSGGEPRLTAFCTARARP